METLMAMSGVQPRVRRWDSTAGFGGLGGWCWSCGGWGRGRGREGSMGAGLGYCGSRFDGGEGRELWPCVGRGGGGGGG